MRRPLIAAAALAAGLACPAAAHADQTVQASDGAAPDGSGSVWLPSQVTVKVGEKVTWRFDGTAFFHNISSAPDSGWSFRSQPAMAGAPAEYTFTQPGNFAFICELHPGPMRGFVTVTDEAGTPPPPPPPPPLSEQPFGNDAPALTSFETVDAQAPALTRVAVGRVPRGARVRFRLSEAARVTLQLTRGGRTVKRRGVNARKGANTVIVRGLRAGRYRVELRARDLSGNAARTQRARITVRS